MPGRVLLIEDEPHIVEAIRFLLVRDGWEVASHGEGTDALAVIRATRPDLVILDVMLPGRSGYDILQDLRAEPGLAGLPVLMLTARGQSRDREMAERLGASRYMAKPFSNAEVLAAVRELAARGIDPAEGAAGHGAASGAERPSCAPQAAGQDAPEPRAPAQKPAAAAIAAPPGEAPSAPLAPGTSARPDPNAGRG